MAVTIRRFARSERAAHWLLAAAFFTMLLSGGMVPHHYSWTNRALDVHVGAAIVLVVGLLALALPGHALKRTARQLATLDANDRAWLSPARLLSGRPAPPVGRFNAGQKMNARLAVLGLGGLYVTGISLLVVRHQPIGGLHGPFAFLTGALVAGHIFMAVLNPSTRHAMRGMTLGSVNRDWAIHHFPRWVEESDRQQHGRDDGPPAGG
ncbi:MAG: formate dehydrogenase subunit gamma [Gaiellales bacterium]|jgi:formate dehydrogenase subunit gamma|nr:formate dehydrogenase subunit gamma [Gaiellales bacterium]